jgi:hypothetical protein
MCLFIYSWMLRFGWVFPLLSSVLCTSHHVNVCFCVVLVPDFIVNNASANSRLVEMSKGCMKSWYYCVIRGSDGERNVQNVWSGFDSTYVLLFGLRLVVFSTSPGVGTSQGPPPPPLLLRNLTFYPEICTFKFEPLTFLWLWR